MMRVLLCPHCGRESEYVRMTRWELYSYDFYVDSEEYVYPQYEESGDEEYYCPECEDIVNPYEDYIEVDHNDMEIFVPSDSYWYEEEHRERLLRLYPGYRVIFDGEEPIEIDDGEEPIEIDELSLEVEDIWIEL